ncbi:MAG: uroporphyrinogen-III C-methyltransferase [Betaproteobacteria bacterium]|nr:uroporphyrinogen-III C-methyltransferase [Betaproteobacteria bacterium]
MDPQAASEPSSSAAPKRRTWRARFGAPFFIVIAFALALLAWQWIETRTRLDLLQQQVAQRLGESDAAARDAKAQARELQDRLEAQLSRLAVVEARMAEAQGQRAALDALYQDLSRSRDEWVLAEIEQALNVAQQQLQLAGNVQAALIALQSAEQRLSGFDRPQLLPLRKSIARDIEKLKAVPMADISSIGLSLENLIERIDALPLAFEHMPKAAQRGARRNAGAPAQSAPAAEEPSWWSALASDYWTEIKQVIRVERLDRPDPALLSPSQAVFLRENLRLRLLSARLALLQRDGRVFRDDTRLAAEWMERYFDVADHDVAQRVAELRRMQTVRLSLELPTLNDTLAALRNARQAGSI